MRWVPVILTAILVAACSGETPRQSFAEGDLLAANAAYDRALIAGDASALEAIYADGFSFTGDHAEQRDRAGQIAYMTDGTVQLLAAHSDDIDVTPLGAEAALLTGRFSGRYRTAAAESDFTERYSSVWILTDEGWKLRHEHSSLAPAG